MSRRTARVRGPVFVSLALSVVVPAHAHDDDWSAGAGSPTGRGQMSIGFQTAHTASLVDQDGVAYYDDLTTDLQSVTLGIDYRLGERWSVHASVPFIRRRASDPVRNHDQARLDEPHPESAFIDDGRFHGAWQDWTLGATWHGAIGAFDVTPHLFVTWPTHDYVFFASAAVGQNLWKARLGVDVARRIGRSNLHASAGYSHEFVERVLGDDADRQHYRLSAWYDFSPRLTVRGFAHMRKGEGLTNADVRARDPALTSELWYQHDRLLTYDYAIAGLGSTFRFDDRWSVSASAATMVWVRVNHDMKYAYDLQLTRAF